MFFELRCAYAAPILVYDIMLFLHARKQLYARVTMQKNMFIHIGYLL